jgi:hypothetical protein
MNFCYQLETISTAFNKFGLGPFMGRSGFWRRTGPRSCPLYESGPARTVPDRHGMPYMEEDWVDDEGAWHWGPDE